MIVVLTISVASGIFEGQPFFLAQWGFLEHDIGLHLQKKAQRKTLSNFAHIYRELVEHVDSSLPY